MKPRAKAAARSVLTGSGASISATMYDRTGRGMAEESQVCETTVGAPAWEVKP